MRAENETKQIKKEMKEGKPRNAVRFIHSWGREGGGGLNTIMLKTIEEVSQPTNDSIPEHAGD